MFSKCFLPMHDFLIFLVFFMPRTKSRVWTHARHMSYFWATTFGPFLHFIANFYQQLFCLLRSSIYIFFLVAHLLRCHQKYSLNPKGLGFLFSTSFSGCDRWKCGYCVASMSRWCGVCGGEVSIILHHFEPASIYDKFQITVYYCYRNYLYQCTFFSSSIN